MVIVIPVCFKAEGCQRPKGEGIARCTTSFIGVVLIFTASKTDPLFLVYTPLGSDFLSVLFHFFPYFKLSARASRSALSARLPFGWMAVDLTFTPWIGPGEIGTFFERSNCSVTGGDNAMVLDQIIKGTYYLFRCIPIRDD